MNQEEYKQKVLEYVKVKHPEQKAEDKEGFQIVTESGILFLNTLYNKAKKNVFEDWENEIDIFLKNLAETTAEEDFSWEKIKNKVFPQIKRIDQLDWIEKESKGEVEHIMLDFLGDLKMAFTVDFPNSFRYVTTDVLKKAEVSIEELKKQAIKNLSESEASLNELCLDKNDTGAILLSWQSIDGYDAARIFLPDFYEIMAKELGEKFVVIVPERDLLIAGNLMTAEELDRQAKMVFGESSHPIWPDLILVTNKGFGPYEKVIKQKTND